MREFKVDETVILVKEPVFQGSIMPHAAADLVIGQTYTVRDVGTGNYQGHIDTGRWWCENDCFELADAPTEDEIAELFGLKPTPPTPLEQAQTEIERLTALLKKHGIDPEEE